MDTSQSENAPNPSIVVERNDISNESVQEIDTSKGSVETADKDLSSGKYSQIELKKVNSLIDKNAEMLHEVQQQCEGVHKDGEDLATEKSVKTVQKQVVEILNVELLTPSTDDYVTSVGNDNELLISEMNENSEDRSLSSSDVGEAENADHEQVLNVTDLVKMETIEVDAIPRPAENLYLTNCSGNVEKNTEPANVENNTEPVKSSGLSLLSQYQSDDDTDSVEEVPLTAAQDYRNQVFEIDSDSDSSDSSSSSDVEYLNELRKTIEKRIEIADEDDDDQEDCTAKKKPHQKLRVKGELLLEDLPPIQDLQITVPENDCVEFGKIHSIVDQLVLVSTLPNSILLDLDTVIFLEKGQKVLGEVFDVLGQVADPLYCVRFNSNKQIQEKQIQIGDVVYVAPKTQYTQYVILSNLITTRGSDASWENDVEPPPRFLDYSDDEQEQLARRQLRNKDRPNDNEDASKRPRTVDDDATSTSGSYHPNTQLRNRYEQRNNRGNPGGYSNIRPRYNGPQQNQQRAPYHHRSSWHSNYNPQNFPYRPPSNFRMHSAQNQPPPPQPHHPNMPAYGVPNAHTMPYSPSQPPPYGVPPLFHQHSQQLMPGPLPQPPNHQQYTSPPPPPGSQ